MKLVQYVKVTIFVIVMVILFTGCSNVAQMSEVQGGQSRLPMTTLENTSTSEFIFEEDIDISEIEISSGESQVSISEGLLPLVSLIQRLWEPDAVMQIYIVFGTTEDSEVFQVQMMKQRMPEEMPEIMLENTF